MWGWYGAASLDDGVAYVDSVETDAFICFCQVTDPTRTQPKGELETCYWYRTSRANLDKLSSKGKALAENISSELRVRQHMRLAMKLQASGYKGSQHPRAMEHAAKERDRL